MPDIRALIVDDEPLARQKIRGWLREEGDVAIVGECGNGQEALAVLSKQPVDVLFLDVQMPEMNGFEMLQQVDLARMPVVIFVTAYDRYAVEAFNVHALDYLLKPYDQQRFKTALERAKAQLQRQEQAQVKDQVVHLLDALAQSNAYVDRLLVKQQHHSFFVRVEEIDWIEAAGNYVLIHTGAQQHLVTEPIGKVEAKLDPRVFLRIHRSTIVHIEAIQHLQPASHGDYRVILKDGTARMMSRSYKKKLRHVLQMPL